MVYLISKNNIIVDVIYCRPGDYLCDVSINHLNKCGYKVVEKKPNTPNCNWGVISLIEKARGNLKELYADWEASRKDFAVRIKGKM